MLESGPALPIVLSQIGAADDVVAREGRDGNCPKSKRIRLTSTAPRLRPPARDLRGREDVRCAMIGIAEIVDRVILHAQRMLDDGAYDWPASRAALERILADLEARSVDDPCLERLRQFIALGDDAWKARHGR